MFFLTFLSVYALPEGSVSVVGDGGFNTSGQEMSINAPDGSIFEHQSFNVSSGETVRFIQPTTESQVLNRILSSESSLVDGSIIGNGKVFFASPGGLIFGEGSVVDVGKLQVIGGNISNENFLTGNYSYDQLLGTVENHGLIQAREVVLAGNRVINSGRILTPTGDTMLLAGDGVQLNSIDGEISVQLSQDNIIQGVVASDLAGQAVLQSGIIQSVKTQISADAIEQSGEIISDEVSMTHFSLLNGSIGKVDATRLRFEPRSSNSGAVARMKGNHNYINIVEATGSFNELEIRTIRDTKIEGVDSVAEGKDIYVQNADFRTVEGSLVISASFAPVFTSSPSTFLAAAENELSILDPVLSFLYDQTVLFGKNMNPSVLGSSGELPNNWYFLTSQSLTVDDLVAGLNPSTIFLLAEENPDFTGFSSGTPGMVGIEDFPSRSASAPPSAPKDPQFSIPLHEFANQQDPGVVPTEQPLGVENVETGSKNKFGLSSEQLKIAMDYGLFSSYSYVIESQDEFISLEDQISELGGTVALFGGSYEQVQTSSDSSASAETTEESQPEDSETEEENEASSSDSTTESGDSSSPISRSTNVAIGAVPFSPISRPVYSPEAAAVLDAALSPKIFEDLQKFTDR